MALFTSKLPEAFVSVSVCTLVKPVMLELRVTFIESPLVVVVKLVPPVIASLSPTFIDDSVQQNHL